MSLNSSEIQGYSLDKLRVFKSFEVSIPHSVINNDSLFNLKTDCHRTSPKFKDTEFISASRHGLRLKYSENKMNQPLVSNHVDFIL